MPISTPVALRPAFSFAAGGLAAFSIVDGSIMPENGRV